MKKIETEMPDIRKLLDAEYKENKGKSILSIQNEYMANYIRKTSTKQTLQEILQQSEPARDDHAVRRTDANTTGHQELSSE